MEQSSVPFSRSLLGICALKQGRDKGWEGGAAVLGTVVSCEVKGVEFVLIDDWGVFLPGGGICGRDLC